MTKYQLIYFNARGRAELARWLFEVAGQEYEDIRITEEKWPEIKPTTPFGQLPLLIVDGDFKLSQTLTIGKFLAKRFGLLGKDEFEEGRCNMVLECTHDMLIPLVDIFLRDGDTRAAAIKKWEGGQRDEFLAKFEKLLKCNNNGDGYFVGNQMTAADMYFCILCDYFANDKTLDWSNFPKLDALRKRVVVGNKKIADWVARRPVTDV